MLSNFRDGTARRFYITFAQHSSPGFIYLISPLNVQTLFTLTWQLPWNFMPWNTCGFITETWRLDNEFVGSSRFLQPRVQYDRRRTLKFWHVVVNDLQASCSSTSTLSSSHLGIRPASPFRPYTDVFQQVRFPIFVSYVNMSIILVFWTDCSYTLEHRDFNGKREGSGPLGRLKSRWWMILKRSL